MEDNARRDAVINLSNITSLDPDTIEAALDEVAQAEGEESVAEGLIKFAPHVIPSAEGLSKKEAKRVLIDEMNYITRQINNRNRNRYKKRLEEYWEKKQAGEKAGLIPQDPFYYKTLSARHIDQVINMARQRGGYEELLKAAGHEPRRRR